MTGKKAFVALSGGVDSAVSAYLLKQEGYDVTGVYMKGWTAPDVECREVTDRQDAARVAAALDIAFTTLDTSEAYDRLVLRPFVDDYARGLTPNPDVLCNSQIKFGVFADFARAHEADVLATGHYARMIDGKIVNGRDEAKDQTYFLWQTPTNVLSMLRFPIGELNKSEVRCIAKEAHIPVAEKKDSQGVCFIGELDMASFLRLRIPKKSGDILNEEGKSIGFHDGVTFFTRGQRHGLGVSASEPLYVAERNAEQNTLTVVPGHDHAKLLSTTVRITQVHLLVPPLPDGEYVAQIRYRGARHPVRIHRYSDDSYEVTATHELFWAPERGQSCVLYAPSKDDFVLLGGGVISAYF